MFNIDAFLREALFTSVRTLQNRLENLSRLFGVVRIIITFCEGDIGGGWTRA